MPAKALKWGQFWVIGVVLLKFSNHDSVRVNQLAPISPSHKFEIKEMQGL